MAKLPKIPYICSEKIVKKLLLLLLVALTVALGGCRSKRAASSGASRPAVPARVIPSTERQVGELVREARKWIGTPYAYGGHSRRGTDCSGMIMEVFKFVYDIKLPRSSAMQREYARPVKFDDMKPGDLVFFATSKNSARVNHVGLYIGDGRMIHASSSRGVMESALNEKYWQRTLHSQGRVIETDAGRKRDKKKKQQTVDETPKPVVEPINERLQQLYDALDQQIDSIYVSNPEIFD